MTTLEKIFNDLAATSRKPSVIRSATAQQEYLACTYAVLQRPRQPDSPAPGEFGQYGKYQQGRLAAVNNLLPEVALAPGALRIEGAAREVLLKATAMVVAPTSPDGGRLGVIPVHDAGGGVYVADTPIPMSRTSDLGECVAHAELQGALVKGCIEHPEVILSITRLRGTVASYTAILEDGDELMYVLLPAADAPTVGEIVMADGSKLRPDAWNDKNRCWKRLKSGERKMKGLGNPISGRREAAKQEQPAVEPVKQEQVSQEDIEKAATAPVVAQVVSAPAEPVQEPEPVQEQVQEPVQEQEMAQQPKPQRTRRAPQATGKYNVAVVQQLANDMSAQADPTDVEQIDAIIDELRALRDLQIVSARRMANLGTAIAKLTRGAVEKYSQIQALMK